MIVHAASNIVGTIQTPTGILSETTQTNSFLSSIIIVITAVAGIWTFWQLLTAGFAYITSNGDKGKIALATAKLNMAIVGIVVVAASFLITAIVSYVIFGDATAILKPQLITI